MWHHIKNNKILITLIVVATFIVVTETQYNSSYTDNSETLTTETLAEQTTQPTVDPLTETTANPTEPNTAEEQTPADITEEQTPVDTETTTKTWDTLLTQLIKAEETNADTYNRDFFKHWVDANKNGCNTRHEVLKAESLTPTTTQNRCTVVEGTWYSPFDDQTFTNPRQIDIDHMVPLKEAWRSGAYAWSDQRREEFANDLDWEYSLIAVSASSNRSKSDRDPANWLPPNTTFTCDYIYQWVSIKIRWELTIDSKEYDTIRNKTETTCSNWEIPQKQIPKP